MTDEAEDRLPRHVDQVHPYTLRGLLAALEDARLRSYGDNPQLLNAREGDSSRVVRRFEHGTGTDVPDCLRRPSCLWCYHTLMWYYHKRARGKQPPGTIGLVSAWREGGEVKASAAVVVNVAPDPGCPHPKARVNKGLCGACGTNVGK